jgi:hypothetical protein
LHDPLAPEEPDQARVQFHSIDLHDHAQLVGLGGFIQNELGQSDDLAARICLEKRAVLDAYRRQAAFGVQGCPRIDKDDLWAAERDISHAAGPAQFRDRRMSEIAGPFPGLVGANL